MTKKADIRKCFRCGKSLSEQCHFNDYTGKYFNHRIRPYVVRYSKKLTGKTIYYNPYKVAISVNCET